MNLSISWKVEHKLLTEHFVNRQEVIDCFANRDTDYTPLIDSREEHLTDPVTQWFISVTDYGRVLKIVYMMKEDGEIIIKSAYEPNQSVIEMYYTLAAPGA